MTDSATPNSASSARCASEAQPDSAPNATPAAQAGRAEKFAETAPHETVQAFVRAGERGDLETLRRLSPLVPIGAGERGGEWTALGAAAANGHLACVEFLVAERGIEDEGEVPALSDAAWAGSAAAVKMLLPLSDTERMAKKGPSSGMRPLDVAASEGHAECVRLLAARTNANWAGQGGLTALMHAVRARKPQEKKAECVRALIPLCDPTATDSGGRDALAWAVGMESPECVEALAPVSDCRRAANNGFTALMSAAALGDERMTRALIPFSDPKQKQGEGLARGGGGSALALAAERGSAACVAALLPVSDAQAKNRKGQTAFAIAVQDKHWDAADLLAEREADQALVAAAFAKAGPKKMPRQAARLEAAEIAQAAASGAEMGAGAMGSAEAPGVAPAAPAKRRASRAL